TGRERSAWRQRELHDLPGNRPHRDRAVGSGRHGNRGQPHNGPERGDRGDSNPELPASQHSWLRPPAIYNAHVNRAAAECGVDGKLLSGLELCNDQLSREIEVSGGSWRGSAARFGASLDLSIGATKPTP